MHIQKVEQAWQSLLRCTLQSREDRITQSSVAIIVDAFNTIAALSYEVAKICTSVSAQRY